MFILSVYLQRQLDKAEKYFQAALLEAKEGFGLRDPHVASALNNLVIVRLIVYKTEVDCYSSFELISNIYVESLIKMMACSFTWQIDLLAFCYQ
jgi:hypothetical protein